jgi:hypothetical protein
MARSDIYDFGKNVKKSKSYKVHGGKDNLLGLQDKARYSRKKRIYAQSFSDTAIRVYEPKFIENIDIFCEKMIDGPNDWSEPKDMSQWCTSLPPIHPPAHSNVN